MAKNRFQVIEYSSYYAVRDIETGKEAAMGDVRQYDGTLVAKLKNGDVYYSDFADFSVCWRWLNRPIFKTLPFTLSFADFTKRREFVIRNDEWKAIQQMTFREFYQYINQ